MRLLSMSASRWLALTLALLCLPASGQIGGLLGQANTSVKLSLDLAAAQPGDTVTAVIALKSTDGWHTYWRNPGDDGNGGPVGQATKIDWTLPQGITAGPVQWPAPTKQVEKEFHTHIFEQASLLVPLTIAADAPKGNFQVKARVRWLECKEECVPGQQDVEASLSIGSEKRPGEAAGSVEAARKLLPAAATAGEAKAYWDGAASADKRAYVIEWTRTGADQGFDFYPYEKQGDVRAKTEPIPGSPARIRKWVGKSDNGWPTSIRGVLAMAKGNDRGASEVALEIGAGSSVAPPEKREPIALSTLLPMLGFAFLGGLILNIMPCVLPVLALKILGFVNQARSAPGYVRQLGLIYGLGVIASFIGLACIALLVQKAGGVAGWSTAFQSPTFRIGLTILMTLVALNLFGLFEVTLHPTATETAFVYASKEGPAGAFFNGILAAVLATPCTAPFLGAAIGFAFTQPPLVLLLFFITAGAGLALPFVALCWQPAWLKLLPRPGHWMVRFKMAMGFPMLATAVWLFWFTATRMGEAGVLWFGLCLVTIAAAAWVWGEFVQRATSRRAVGIGISVALILAALFVLLPQADKKSKIAWSKWSAEAVARAQAEGKPVLVDFTADNCLNCKFNKATSIEVESTIRQLTSMKAVTLIGDFTDADPDIARELAKYGRRGVPLVLVYPKTAGVEPKVLPTVLTPAIVQEALEWAARN